MRKAGMVATCRTQKEDFPLTQRCDFVLRQNTVTAWCPTTSILVVIKKVIGNRVKGFVRSSQLRQDPNVYYKAHHLLFVDLAKQCAVAFFWSSSEQLGQLELGQSSFHWIANPPSSSPPPSPPCKQNVIKTFLLFNKCSGSIKKTAIIVGNKPFAPGSFCDENILAFVVNTWWSYQMTLVNLGL